MDFHDCHSYGRDQNCHIYSSCRNTEHTSIAVWLNRARNNHASRWVKYRQHGSYNFRHCLLFFGDCEICKSCISVKYSWSGGRHCVADYGC